MKTLLTLSVGGSVLGILLMIMRRCTGGKLSSRFYYRAWLLVLLRFILPVQGLFQMKTPAPEPAPSAVYLPVPTVQTETEIVPATAEAAPDEKQTTITPVVETAHSEKGKLADILLAVWLGGAVLAFAIPAFSYFRFSKTVRRTLQRAGKGDFAVYNALIENRRLQLARSRAIRTPMTFGLFSPVLVLPDAEYDEKTLEYILAHELTHFHRRDIVRKWFALLVFALHWFNPLVYLFKRELEVLCELSCDEILIRRMGQTEKQEYGETLLKVAQNAAKLPTSMATGIAGDKKNLKERLMQIMQYKKKGKIAGIAALLAALLLAGCGAVLGPAGEVKPKTVEAASVDELLAAITPNTEIYLAPGTYDLTEAKNYGKQKAGKYLKWNSLGFEGEYELEITGVENLKILGSTAEGDSSEIVTVPRSVNVLKFSNCSGTVLECLSVGHTEAAEACQGGVIYLDNCVNTFVNDCLLYGCGTIGVWGNGCDTVNIRDTHIYHCSGCGVNFNQSKNIKMARCRAYDCGKAEQYMSANYLFCFSDTENVAVTDCEVYDNYAQGIVHTVGTGNTKFERLNVHNNHLKSFFGGSGLAEISELSLEDNIIDMWMQQGETEGYTLNGRPVNENELNEKYKSQLSSAGVGAIEAESVTADTTGVKTVHVSTADEFVAAIASDTRIYIDVPQINLMDASAYGTDAAERFAVPDFSGNSCEWRDVFDGCELCIGHVKNLHIVGGEIVTEPRYANVLSFYGCENVSLDSVKLGHTKEQGQCAGGVVYLYDSENILVESCDLYGCGILGIQAKDIRNLHVQNTLIHDCNLGAAQFTDSQDVAFLGCAVQNCPDAHFMLQNCEGFSWDKKLMDANCAFNVSE